MWAVPDITQVKFGAGLVIANSPINMDKVITFDVDEFDGLDFEVAPDTPNVEIIGSGVFSKDTNSVIGIGLGYPAITFKIGHKKHLDSTDDVIQWVFLKEKERDDHFENLLKLIKKG